MTTKIVVSYSELDTFRQCPLKHQLAYLQRWTKPTPPGTARDRGHSWHAILETHYNLIRLEQNRHGGRRLHDLELLPALRRISDRVSRAHFSSASGEITDQQQLLEWMYLGYLKRYGLDPDWLILEVEQQIEVPLPTESGRKSNLYWLKARLDLVVKDPSGHVWLVDHKSHRYLPNGRELQIDDQFGLYTWARKAMGQEVFGAIHSATRTDRTKGDIDGTKPLERELRFARTPMFRTDVELGNLAIDAARTAKASRSTSIPYSSPAPDICKWKCDFLEAHMDMRAGIGSPERVLRGHGFEQDFTRH